jgi:hypothetical protein
MDNTQSMQNATTEIGPAVGSSFTKAYCAETTKVASATITAALLIVMIRKTRTPHSN